ncbi:DUF4012 domain-containing protein [Candidatus Parcubacteria bacterium]|nr:MAG: DUF4012 domain-containing protein [Candidatus Parcubacteria bacterium]
MPKFIKTETKEKENPVILIYGNNPLIENLVENYHLNFKLIIISDAINIPENLGKNKNIHVIEKDSTALIQNIEDKINYVIFFLESQSDKKNFDLLYPKLNNNVTKTSLIIQVKEFENYYDLLIGYKKEENIFFLLLGDLFGESIDPQTNQISTLIALSIVKKSVTLPIDNLIPTYTISTTDAIKGINHIIFSSHKKNAIYYLFYKVPQTLISSIHMFKRVEPDLEMTFDENQQICTENTKTFEDFDNEIKSKLLLEPQVLDKYFIGFEKSLLKISETKNIAKTLEEKLNKSLAKNKHHKKNSFKISQKFIFIPLVSLGIFILLNILSLLTTLFFAKYIISSIQQNNYSKSIRLISQAKYILAFSEPSIVISQNFPFFKDQLKIFQKNYYVAQKNINFLSYLVSTSKDLNSLSKNTDSFFWENVSNNLIHLYFEAEKIKAENLSTGKQESNQLINKFVNEDTSKFSAISTVIPEILGSKEDKYYLILFQNNGELRPTGGFIGSVGEISFSKGKVKDFLIRDVYELDGQLKAHVEPHYIIRRNLQPHLYLRDSNFDPDFQKSASLAALIYNFETSKKIDGVIAVNYEVLKEVIKEIGPIDLPEYKKTLDENNTFEFLQNVIETNFFPGSTQKRDILNSLFNQILTKIEQDPNSLYKALLLFPKQINEKQILFAFNNNSIQNIFSVSGFSGNFLDLRIRKENGIYDTFAINEANIGVNKENIFVDRKVEYDLYLNKEKSSSKITFTLSNKGKSYYKTYIRFLLPQNTNITSIKIDNKEQKITPAVTDFKIYEKPDFKPKEGLEVDSFIYQSFILSGFITQVNENSSQKIEISYENLLKIPDISLFPYSLLHFKQPGVLNYPLTATIHYPKEYGIYELKDKNIEEGKISQNTEVSRDQEIKFNLIKK